jgi:hypothetical protein
MNMSKEGVIEERGEGTNGRIVRANLCGTKAGVDKSRTHAHSVSKTMLFDSSMNAECSSVYNPQPGEVEQKWVS